MKAKQLATLVILAAAIGILAYVSREKDRRQFQLSDRIGKNVFPDMPINDVSSLVIVRPGATSVVARTKDGKWAVPDRWNYPAKFDKVADTLVMLSELKVQQVIQPTPGNLAAFKLHAPGAAASESETGVEARLLDAGGKNLISFVIGKERMRQPAGGNDPMMAFGAFPDGQYIRHGDGPVLLVSGRLGDLADPAGRWLEDDFVSVPASDIMEMTITGPGRDEIKLARSAPGEALHVSGLAANQEADEAKVSQMSGVFSYLNFDDIANPDMTADKLGLAKPVRITARTQANRTYVFEIGSPVSDSDPNRYVKVSNSYAALPMTNAPSDEKLDEAARKALDDKRKAHEEETARLALEAASFNQRMTNWVFVVRWSRLEPLFVPRAEIVTLKPADTNAVSEAKTAPAAAPVPQPAKAPAPIVKKAPVKTPAKDAVKAPAKAPAPAPAPAPATAPAAKADGGKK